jgi:hypothetical protein
MRSKEFVKEIVKIPRSQFLGDEGDLPLDIPRSRAYPFDNEIKIYFTKNIWRNTYYTDDFFAVLAIPKYDRVIGQINYEFDYLDTNLKIIKIDASVISEDYRGRGIMTKAYKALMLHHKLPIVAGNMQTVKAQRLWANLRRDSDIELMGYINFDREVTEKRTLDALKRAGAVKPDQLKDNKIYILPLKYLKSNILSFRKKTSYRLYDYGDAIINRYTTGLIAYPKSMRQRFR